MNFPAFLSFLQIQSVIKSDTKMLYRDSFYGADYYHSTQTMFKMILMGSAFEAEIIYKCENHPNKTTYNMIHCDIFFTGFINNDRTLFMKKVSVSKMIEMFTDEIKLANERRLVKHDN